MLIVEVYSRGFILNWHPQLMDCSTDSLIPADFVLSHRQKD